MSRLTDAWRRIAYHDGTGLLTIQRTVLRQMFDEMDARASRAEADADRLAEVLQALRDSFATDSRDWSKQPGDAWRYGVVCGWCDANESPVDGDDGDALAEIAAMHPRLDIDEMCRLWRAQPAHDEAVARR